MSDGDDENTVVFILLNEYNFLIETAIYYQAKGIECGWRSLLIN